MQDVSKIEWFQNMCPDQENDFESRALFPLTATSNSRQLERVETMYKWIHGHLVQLKNKDDINIYINI